MDGKSTVVELIPPARTSPFTVLRLKRRWVACVGPVAGALLAALVSMRFELPPAMPGIPMPSALVDYGLPVARALTDLAAAAMFGFGLTPLLALGTSALHRDALRLSVAAAVVLTAAASGSLLAETANLWTDRPLGLVLLAGYVASEPTGQALLATAVFALISLWANSYSLNRPTVIPAELRLILAALTSLPLPLTGHADNPYHGLIILSREVHVLAAAAWTGGLFALANVVFGHRIALAVALPRFSRLATAALDAVTVTGIVDAVIQLGGRPGARLFDLLQSPYGWIVLAKLSCLAVLAALGGRIRFRLGPAIVAGRRVALFAWARAELTIMGLAYGLAAVLANSAA